jgi:hypothetical protein
MKTLRVSLTVIVLIGAMVISVPPVCAQDPPSQMVRFGPLSIGRNQCDVFYVENFTEMILKVEVTARNPVTGRVLDMQEIEVLPGKGARMLVTLTIPNPHTSSVFFLVTPVNGAPIDGEGLANGTNEPQFRITRVLVNKWNFNTVLQVSKVRMLNGIEE